MTNGIILKLHAMTDGTFIQSHYKIFSSIILEIEKTNPLLSAEIHSKQHIVPFSYSISNLRYEKGDVVYLKLSTLQIHVQDELYDIFQNRDYIDLCGNRFYVDTVDYTQLEIRKNENFKVTNFVSCFYIPNTNIIADTTQSIKVGMITNLYSIYCKINNYPYIQSTVDSIVAVTHLKTSTVKYERYGENRGHINLMIYRDFNILEFDIKSKQIRDKMLAIMLTYGIGNSIKLGFGNVKQK